MMDKQSSNTSPTQAKLIKQSQQTTSALSNADDVIEERIELENLLNTDDLEELREHGFLEDNVLNKQQFISFLQNTLKRGTEKDYEELFECIDVTKEGVVSWDKLATYLMLKLYDNDDREKASSVPNWKGLKSVMNAHRDSIKRIQHMDHYNRYLSISKEGSVCIYDEEMQLYKTFKTSTEACKARDLWITYFVLMPNLNKIAVAYTSKEIIIYEVTSKLEFGLVYRIVDLKATPFCLDYWSDEENLNDAILSWGDVKGSVHAILFNSAQIALFERPAQPSSNETPHSKVKLEDISNGNYKNASYLCYDAHSEWTRKVQYIEHLECFISCSTNPKTALVVGWLERAGSTIKITDFGRERSNYSVRIRQLREKRTVEISQGLNSFDYTRNFNLIATAGVNYQVCLWNPYVLSKPNGVLRGHMRSVLCVQFIASRGQLLSFSKDKILRIWDVQLQICLQRLSNTFPRGPEVDVFVWFDDPRNRLFASFRTNVCMLEIKPEIKGRIMTHDKPIIAARYSTKQKQVMIVCQAGDVSFWSIEQGQKTKRFSERQGEADVTCIGFDEFGEKFYTGSSDGKIRVWNYNGRLIQTLDAGRGSACEISQIEALKRRIVAVGWSKHLTVFRDVDQIEHNRGQTSTWLGKEVHEDDIVCMALTNFTPQLLATGSADGDICLWNTSSELFIRRLDQRKRNPNNTQAKLQDNAADFAITTLKFLDKRIQQSTNDGSNLVSCGGVGYTRFWNAYTGLLVAEFQAHSDVSSIVMEIDLKNKYLATGDVNGLVKVWEIEQYCRHTSDNLVKTLPPLLSEFTRHIDSITCLDFVEKDERTYLITSSSDCSVALSDVNGNIYGIFGQANNWRLDLQNSNDKDDRRQEENDDAESEQKITDSSDITSFRSTVDYDLDTISNMTDDEMLTRRSNVWDKTTIGVSYQERRTHGRRQRNQPGLIQTKQFALWEKTGLAPGGAYGSLETFDLPVILDPKKTSVTDNSYFLQRGSVEPLSSGTRRRPPSVIGENLKSAFDERSIFPKYILDYEAKQRQLNELTNTQQQTTNEKTVLRPIDSIRATTIKRLNSSSTYSEQN